MKTTEKANTYFKLLLRKQGRTTEQENIDLDAILAKDEEMATIWKEMLENDYGVVEHTDEEAAYQRFAPIMLDNPQKTPMYKTLIRIAAALIGAFAVYYFLEINPRVKIHHNSREIKGSYIELAGGELIALPACGPDSTVKVVNGRLQFITVDLPSLLPGGTSKATVVVDNRSAYRFTLGDGSVVFVNSGSSLTSDLSDKNTRRYSVSGDAYFEVAAYAKAPFIVSAGSATVKVLGTKFNVSSVGSAGRISLVSGSVLVTSAKDSLMLAPGKQANLDSAGTIKVTDIPKAADLFWMNGDIAFYDEPMESIIKQLQERYDVHIVLDNPELAGQRFTITFGRNEDFFSSFKAMGAAIRSFSVYETADTIHVAPISTRTP
ncbi:DUF4974 domain-containing protein [Chitinophaga polysaccharea]|uniref:FecR family protein n=1 Tax=Chitinophaga polysaccharea TaxID=1293035 RepID=UPI001455979A|nr:FecR domain-containing protein [Chitinophaga polysaccharea]NLR60715.1 DUF4974 domain-containing protein [Chitinophaga polysaccharea]